MRKIFLAMAGGLLVVFTSAGQEKNLSKQENAMKKKEHPAAFTSHLQQMYTVFITRDVEKKHRFYKKWFGMETVFESTWFVLLSTPVQSTLLAFMSEQHPSSPPDPKAVKGEGAFLTFQVEDASAVYTAMKEAGISISYDLREEPWGQKRFGVVDPDGMWIDVVEQIQPASGFWDPYLKK